MCVYMCVYIYIYIYICISLSIYIYIYTYKYEVANMLMDSVFLMQKVPGQSYAAKDRWSERWLRLLQTY